jgi:uncharacterized protein
MEFEWDEAKRRANLAKPGVDFANADAFDWDSAVVYPDLRHDYGEERFIAFAEFHHRVHVVIYAKRDKRTRLIGFRKANAREVRRYEKEKARS